MDGPHILLTKVQSSQNTVYILDAKTDQMKPYPFMAYARVTALAYNSARRQILITLKKDIMISAIYESMTQRVIKAGVRVSRLAVDEGEGLIFLPI